MRKAIHFLLRPLKTLSFSSYMAKESSAPSRLCMRLFFPYGLYLAFLFLLFFTSLLKEDIFIGIWLAAVPSPMIVVMIKDVSPPLE